MKWRHLLFLAPLAFCQCDFSEPANIFTENPELVDLYNYQDQRDFAGVIAFLHHEDALLRERAAMAFGSMTDTNALEFLLPMLEDEDAPVRKAAAWAIGQIGHTNGEAGLLKSFGKEKIKAAKIEMLEALGKCGSQLGLAWVVEINSDGDPSLQIAQARAIYRFTLRDHIYAEGTALALKLIDKDVAEEARFYAAQYLARTKNLDLTPHDSLLWSNYWGTTEASIQLPLILAMGKAKTETIQQLLVGLLNPHYKASERIMALRALNSFEGEAVEKAVWSQLSDSLAQVSELAARWWVNNGRPEIADQFIPAAGALYHWRTKAYLMEAAVKHGGAAQLEYAETTFGLYQASENPYEKGALLMALSHCPAYANAILEAPFQGKSIPLKTAALEALIAARKSGTFDHIEDSDRLFMHALKRALESGNPALVALTAVAYRDPAICPKPLLPTAEAFMAVVDQLALPREVETCNELKKTIAGITSETYEPCIVESAANPINWDRIIDLPKGQRMVIKTIKGDIEIQLLVEEAPGSVANFLDLIHEGFYNDFVFHRVVPGFVVQDGCPRGDGFGSPDKSIRSEFFPRTYKTGTIGMASVGPDTESSQWFITHVPTPHLDGRYTIFAVVTKGMEIVQQLGVGDVVDYELPVMETKD